MNTEDEVRQLESARLALMVEFAGSVPAEEVDRRFTALVVEFESAPVRNFVPVLVQRQVRAALRSKAT